MSEYRAQTAGATIIPGEKEISVDDTSKLMECPKDAVFADVREAFMTFYG